MQRSAISNFKPSQTCLPLRALAATRAPQLTLVAAAAAALATDSQKVLPCAVPIGRLRFVLEGGEIQVGVDTIVAKGVGIGPNQGPNKPRQPSQPGFLVYHLDQPRLESSYNPIQPRSALGPPLNVQFHES